MKFPFFKGPKTEPKSTSTVFVPPRAATGRPTGAAPAPIPVQVETSEESVPVRLSSILPQLPRNLFGAADRGQFADVTLSVPSRLVLPQLSSGKVAVTLAELAPALPAHLVNQSVLNTAEQHTVMLPLAEMIAALPPEAFKVRHETVISLDEPELAKLPALFQDEVDRHSEIAPLSAAAEPDTEAVTMPPPAEVLASLPAPAEAAEVVAEEPAEESAPAPEPVPAAIGADVDVPVTVNVTLRSIVNALPDKLLRTAKAEVLLNPELQATAPLPVEPMLPQLQTARVTLPASMVIGFIPATILVSPLPSVEDVAVVIPLAEIIPQLPARLFISQLSSTEPRDFAAVETEIPTPFQERVRVTPTPAPEPAIEEAVSEEIGAEELESEEVTIFAEKTPATPPAPVRVEPRPAAPLPETQRLPVPELPKTPVGLEPVAPAAPVEPAPAPAVEPAPVVAEPVPVTGPKVVPMPAPGPEPLPLAAAAAPVAPAPVPVESAEPPPVEALEMPTVPPVRAAEPEPTGMPAVLDEKKFLVDLNRCSVEDLLRIEGVGRTLAQRIIDFRTNRGQFTSVDELRLIPGIGRKTFRALAGMEPRSLNRLLGVEDDRELTLQEIVKLTSALKGIEGCMLAMSDGLFLTGHLPDALDQEAISVFAPQLFKRMSRYVKELKVGQVRRFTLFTDERPISVFRAADVYLIIIHDTRHFSKKLLRQCERISQEIARLCRQRTVV